MVTHPSCTFPRPGAVLFDLDGTLIDSIQLIVEAAEHAFRGRAGRAPTRAEWVAGIGTPLVTQLREFAADEADLGRLLAGYRTYQQMHHDRLTRCFDGIVEVIGQLRARGHPLGIVTSKVDASARRSLEHVGLLPLMDVIVGADACTRHKPDPEPVRLALGMLGHSPREAVYVGDTVHDMAAGRAAGVHTIGVTWGACTREQLESAGAEGIVDGSGELLQAIGALW